eukprot:CAMPEP_0115170912 /NCGR_PEP_ID=MMETSP0270-20121206/2037_1 /TAXON_ID=71861 /ORGANISM="Scrippsiella trochoidea, Strain CCMP3099" /LENGTH=228 /DNA_ID=CAMNT_0002583673 /DNA_START=19 /DNA_END=702 /DNA_ORIENTATION=-
MTRRGRSSSEMALASFLAACYCGPAIAKNPSVDIEPYLNYRGSLRVRGVAKFVFNADDSIDFAWRLSGADIRCSHAVSQLALGACRFELHQGRRCSEPLEQLGKLILARRKSGASEDPCVAATRYNVSIDGQSNEAREMLKLDLTQNEIFGHALLVTDADGMPVACGSVTSACITVLGICFYQWMRILLMVPIYSLQSFIALWFKVNPVAAELLEFFRKLIESIVIVA